MAHRITLVLFNIFAWTVFCMVAAIMFPICFVVYLASLLVDHSGYIVNCFLGAWAHLYIFLHPGWSIRVEGRDKLPRRGGAFFVANHQSLVDGMVVYTLFSPFHVVSKLSVLWVPVAGWCLAVARPILLARGNKKSIAKMSQSISDKLANGGSVLLFPEGTRSADGEIHEFQKGAFTIMTREDRPIFPVIIDGTGQSLPKHSVLLSLRADIHIRVLDAIYPSALCDAEGKPLAKKQRAEAARVYVQELMTRELSRMRQQAQPSTVVEQDIPQQGQRAS